MERNLISIIFDNIGDTIQKAAKIIFGVNIINVIIGAAKSLYNYLEPLEELGDITIKGLWYASKDEFFFFVKAVIFTILMYGFGKLVEEVAMIRSTLQLKNEYDRYELKNIKAELHILNSTNEPNAPATDNSDETVVSQLNKNDADDEIWVCEKCKVKNRLSNDVCWNCNNPK